MYAHRCLALPGSFVILPGGEAVVVPLRMQMHSFVARLVQPGRANKTTVEREWQLSVATSAQLAQVRRWLERYAQEGGITIAKRERYVLTDDYLDTSDWRFYRAGVALRHRRVGEQRSEVTLKALNSTTPAFKTRWEASEHFSQRLTHTALRAFFRSSRKTIARLVRDVAGAMPIERKFRVVNHRDEFQLRLGLSRITVALDRFKVTAAAGSSSPHYRIEIELDSDSDEAGLAAVEEFVAKLQSVFRAVASCQSKFAMGLQMCEAAPATVVQNFGEPATVAAAGANPLAMTLAYAVLREQWAAFRANEAGARLGADPEYVHRMRVATRRMRTALRVFRQLFPPQAQQIRSELQWIARVLGAVRDIDVQQERLWQWQTEGVPLDVAAVHSHLRRQWQRAHRKLIDAFNSRRYAKMVEQVEEFLRKPVEASPLALLPARQVLPSLILRLYAAVRECGDTLTAASPPTAYHLLRIRIKRLRYVLEFSRHVYPAVAERFVPRLVEVQDVLGSYQDAHVAIEWLSSQQKANGVHARGAGYIERWRATMDNARAQLPRLYRRIKGAAWMRVVEILDQE